MGPPTPSLGLISSCCLPKFLLSPYWVYYIFPYKASWICLYLPLIRPSLITHFRLAPCWPFETLVLFTHPVLPPKPVLAAWPL